MEKVPYKIGSDIEIADGLSRLTIDGIELVIVKKDETVTVFGGECLHEGALMSGGFIEGDFLVCGKHLWRYNLDTGELDKEPGVGLKKLSVWRESGDLYIDQNEVDELAESDEEFDEEYPGDGFPEDY